MHRLASDIVDGEIAYQKAILAAMADTWKHAQGTTRHTSQASILLEVSDKLIKTPTNLRGMVDNIHTAAVERCKEGTLETWSLWRFYLSALGERLKAGDYQVKVVRLRGFAHSALALCDLGIFFASSRVENLMRSFRPASFGSVAPGSLVVPGLHGGVRSVFVCSLVAAV